MDFFILKLPHFGAEIQYQDLLCLFRINSDLLEALYKSLSHYFPLLTEGHNFYRPFTALIISDQPLFFNTAGF
jgi:hypothetical protein